MRTGTTKDPHVALSGLVALAVFGVLTVGGGLMASGLMDGSWIRVVGGAGFIAGLSWMTWQAALAVRAGLRDPLATQRSGR